MNRHVTAYLLHALNIQTRLLYSSEMDAAGTKSELVLNLCRTTGADTYLSGPFGRDYLDQPSFQAAGINVKYDDYKHPCYPQFHGSFVPHLSIIDLLFNCGHQSREIILNGQEQKT